jgi:hypothetical protein
MNVRIRCPALFLIVLFVIGAGCSTTAPAPQITPATPIPLFSVAIQPDITHYTVLMSSTVGIGLTPNITGPLPAGNLSYVWKANYGHLLGWNAPGYTVQELGSIVTVNGTKVYWTYLGENESTPRPPVHVTLDVTDPSTGVTLGHAEQEIGWDANDTAVIG